LDIPQTTNYGIFGYLNTYDFDGEYATWTTDGAKAGTVFYRNGKFNCTNVCGTLQSIDSLINIKYLTYFLNTVTKQYVNYVGNPKLMNEDMGQIKLPLPPLEIQQKIVDEISKIEEKEKEEKNNIDSLNRKISNLLSMDFPKYSLDILCNNLDYKRKPISKINRNQGSYPYYGATGIIDYIDDYIFDDELLLIGEDGAKWGADEKSSFIVKGKFWANNHVHILKPNNKVNIKLLSYYLNILDLSSYITGLNVPKLNQKNLHNIKIPVPTLDQQKEIVREIDLLEEKIKSSQNYLNNAKNLKQNILDKYLK
jgi:restriction endonuclease S subunit